MALRVHEGTIAELGEVVKEIPEPETEKIDCLETNLLNGRAPLFFFEGVGVAGVKFFRFLIT
ncbi:hypothetical protein [Variovorax sp. 54]|uniref:hypothetical protein n=1 Tax=Variovorax sp. 54 TaxID=2035212 RepID=UPI0015D47757|nr:hypothetical protein [Variovorax sp. 54]